MENSFRRKGIEVIIKNQRFDGYEAWIRKGESEWVRIDFMLEYYISRSLSVTNKYKGSFRDESYAKLYVSAFLDRYIDTLSNTSKFKINEYQDWIRGNSKEIEEAKNLLRSS